ncbi:MAG TPA: hypothetical protein VMW16_09160 [Sedimentisphaerales bacterium]|nr:hypothetical protein [Sedimentisphaerales bacterium]
MAENKENLKLDALRAEIREPLKAFAGKVVAELGDNLQSITVVGSGLTEDYRSGQSDINTVLVLGKLRLDSLKVLAGMAKSMSKKKISAPLLMTEDYIGRSCDVFGIEFLDFQLTHETIFGGDPFAGLTFAKTDVRLQCERELKATLIRLRQGYVASGTNRKLVRDILASAAGSLIPLLRAMLWLKDIGRAGPAEQVFGKAAAEFSINVDALLAARGWRHAKVRVQEDEIAWAFESIYQAVEGLALAVDAFEV